VAVKKPFLRKANRKKRLRSGLNMSGNRSFGGMNPPQRTSTLYNHLDREQKKDSQHPKKSLV